MKPAYSNPSSPCGCRFESYLRSRSLLEVRELSTEEGAECRRLCRKIEEMPGPREDFVDAVMARASVTIFKKKGPFAVASLPGVALPAVVLREKVPHGVGVDADAAGALRGLREYVAEHWFEVVSQMALAMKGERFLKAGGGR